jgi:hypothetical protein
MKGARAPARGDRISVIFSWARVSSADSYQLQVSSSPDFKTLIEDRTTGEHGALLKQAPLKGRVFWRVRSKNPSGGSPWSETSYFDVN